MSKKSRTGKPGAQVANVPVNEFALEQFTHQNPEAGGRSRVRIRGELQAFLEEIMTSERIELEALREFLARDPGAAS